VTIEKNTGREALYHGTRPERAMRILEHGFKVGEFDLWGDGERVRVGDGNIGFGTYISADFRIALWFGRVLLKMHLRRGTRILRMEKPTDEKRIRYLQREFGRAIVETSDINSVLPRNKRLTLSEHIALLSYHFERTRKYFWMRQCLSQAKSERKWVHVAAMHNLGAGLRRFGLHGYGDPYGENGIVVFEPDRIVVDDVPIVLPDRLWSDFQDKNSFARIGSLEELKRIAVGCG